VFLLHCPLKVSNLARLIITDDIVDSTTFMFLFWIYMQLKYCLLDV
jgi:hypothetical protein